MTYAFVAGSPRSGTSAMMRLLKDQGVPLFYDEARVADGFNPSGYFETLEIANLSLDKGTKLLAQSSGRLFKLNIPALIPHLPVDFNYKVIWMERDPLESAQSLVKLQTAAAVRRGEQFTPDINSLAQRIKEGRQFAEAFMERHNFDVLRVPMEFLSDHILAAKNHIAPAISKNPPTIPSKIASAISAAHRFARAGFATTPPEILAARQDICKACPEWDAQALNNTGRCRKCGCSTWAKLRMATERCPLGKWEAVDKTDK